MRIVRAILPVWAGLAAVLVAAPTMAADAQMPPPETAPEPVWTFTVEPFFWAASLDGRAGVHGLGPVDVNIDFDQIFNHIDWWPPPVMLNGEARNGQLRSFHRVHLPGTRGRWNRARPVPHFGPEDLDMVLWTFGGSYRVVENGTATLDVLAGGRLWSLNSDLTLAGPRGNVIQDSDSKTWVDPQIGVAGSVDLGSGFGLNARGRYRWLRCRRRHRLAGAGQASIPVQRLGHGGGGLPLPCRKLR